MNQRRLLLPLNMTYPRRLNRHACWHCRRSLRIFHQPRQMLHHNSLTISRLRSQIRQHGFKPGLIRTHAHIYRSIPAVGQVTDQLFKLGTHIRRLRVDQRRQHNSMHTMRHTHVTLRTVITDPTNRSFRLRFNWMKQRRHDLMKETLHRWELNGAYPRPFKAGT